MGGGGALWGWGYASHSHHGPHLTFDCAPFIAMPSSWSPPSPDEDSVTPLGGGDLIYIYVCVCVCVCVWTTPVC